ncbi:condensation domain-containing protein [Streptomyces sp. NPDC001941]|uniref:condensation domain-containing protein n=1 Tax=Streptomyces sp. NPDC001941 TaxID=3154659 RepID=UPI0033169FE3
MPPEPMTVVVDLGAPGADGPPALELRGPLDTLRLEAALDRIAARYPHAPAWHPRLQHHGPGHHTLRLTTGAGGGEDFPAGLLADLLTHEEPAGPPVRFLEPTPLQGELLATAGPGRHVEQLAFGWHGPLDPERFTAAWQSVHDRESVLRARFEDGPEPRVVLHEHATADVVRLPHGSVDWYALVEADRRRGLDPRRTGPLRVTVLGGGASAPGTGPVTKVLLTHHHALLDGHSVRLLLREFWHAYLAEGLLPGGERRPDLADYRRWLHQQDTSGARDFWSSLPELPYAAEEFGRASAPDAPAATSHGTGHMRLRLTVEQTARLAAWAARWGSTESGVLQAVWALLLHHAQGTRGPGAVRFSAAVSGRGVLFDGVERLPAPLRNPQPVTVEIAPDTPLPELLAVLREHAVDASAYEWVTAGQIQEWTGGRVGPGRSVVAFEHRLPADARLRPALAAHGVRAEAAETLGARTAFPVGLVAHHDDEGRLVLTLSHDRAHLADGSDVLAPCALLLRELPYLAGDSTTVGEALDLLGAVRTSPDRVCVRTPAPTGPARTAPAEEPRLSVLRPAARPGAGTVCLVHAPGTPPEFYATLVHGYPGPEALALLRPAADGAPVGAAVLRALAGTGGPLVLGALSGGGVAAYETARLVAAHGGRPPLIVLTGTGTAAADLARMLEAAAERAG